MVYSIATAKRVDTPTTNQLVIACATVDRIIAVSRRDQLGTICSSETVVAIRQDLD